MSLGMVIVGAIIVINVTACIVMLIDKRRSMQSSSNNRISEGVLFFIAVLFGSAGVLVGMVLFRHKIRKWYFYIGIPALVLQHCLLGAALVSVLPT